MKTFDIYVDSGANIPDELRKSRGIKIISYRMTVNGEDRLCYEEGVPFEETAKRFYDDMRAGAEVKTSLLNAQSFYDELLPSVKEGKDVILFTISSGISATNKQAQEAGRMLEEDFAPCKVYVIDSENASMGEGLLALRTADLRDMGESAETCAKWARENAFKTNSYLTVGDLKYLKRTGRISTTLAIAGTLLNIKPVLRADGGANTKIVFYGKERGRKRALAALAEAFKEHVIEPENQTVAICHGDCKEDAEYLAGLVKELGARDVIIEYYDLCTGSHVGPGTVALFFFGKDRRGTASPAPEKSPAGKVVPHKA